MSKNDMEKLIENLKDAGFEETEIKEFIELYKNNTPENQCECLQKKRKKLLDKIHKSEKCLDCLDYLKYSLEKEKEKTNE